MAEESTKPAKVWSPEQRRKISERMKKLRAKEKKLGIKRKHPGTRAPYGSKSGLRQLDDAGAQAVLRDVHGILRHGYRQLDRSMAAGEVRLSGLDDAHMALVSALRRIEKSSPAPEPEAQAAQ